MPHALWSTQFGAPLVDLTPMEAHGLEGLTLSSFVSRYAGRTDSHESPHTNGLDVPARPCVAWALTRTGATCNVPHDGAGPQVSGPVQGRSPQKADCVAQQAHASAQKKGEGKNERETRGSGGGETERYGATDGVLQGGPTCPPLGHPLRGTERSAETPPASLQLTNPLDRRRSTTRWPLLRARARARLAG